jgi:hypothetical protein
MSPVMIVPPIILTPTIALPTTTPPTSSLNIILLHKSTELRLDHLFPDLQLIIAVGMPRLLSKVKIKPLVDVGARGIPGAHHPGMILHHLSGKRLFLPRVDRNGVHLTDLGPVVQIVAVKFLMPDN